MLYFAHEKQGEKAIETSSARCGIGVAEGVLRLRVKDKHDAVLKAEGKEVNVVWNDTQDWGLEVLAREGGLVWAFEVAGYTKGAGKEGLTLHSQKIQEVSEEYVLRVQEVWAGAASLGCGVWFQAFTRLDSFQGDSDQ